MSDSTVSNNQKPAKALIFGLWVVAIYFVFTSVGNIVVHIMLNSGQLPLTHQQEDYWKDLNFIVIIIARVLMVLNLTGGILLILRRRLALKVLVASVVLNVLTLLLNLATRGIAPDTTVGLLMFQYGLLIAVVGFVYHLYRKNVLWH